LQNETIEDSEPVLVEIAKQPQPELIVEKIRHHKLMKIDGHTYCLKKVHRHRSVKDSSKSTNASKAKTLDDIEIIFEKKPSCVPAPETNEVRFS
jgi:hypothetical protein